MIWAKKSPGQAGYIFFVTWKLHAQNGSFSAVELHKENKLRCNLHDGGLSNLFHESKPYKVWKCGEKRQTNQRYISVGQILTVFIRIHLPHIPVPCTFAESVTIPLNNKDSQEGSARQGPLDVAMWGALPRLCHCADIKSFHQFFFRRSTRGVSHK